MALQILKLAINAQSTVETFPTVQKFFSVAPSTLVGETTLTIDTADFWDDTGAEATTLPALNPDNSFITVYVNGVQVMQDLVSYTPGASGTGELTITVPTGSSILQNSPIVLIVTNFTPTAQTTIET